jgi:predicted nucleotidyltransferase
MLTQIDAINLVKNYANEIKQHGINLKNVMLFGSFANGTQHKWSDIDVALVADEFTGSSDEYNLFPKIGIKKPYTIIETKTYPTKYFRKGDPFVDEIKKTGIRVKINTSTSSVTE